MLPNLKESSFDSTSGSRTSGDPSAVWAVMRVITVSIQAALMSLPAPHRSGGRRLLIAGQPRVYQHASASLAWFAYFSSTLNISFHCCQWVRACCCSPNIVSIPARSAGAYSGSSRITGGGPAPPLRVRLPPQEQGTAASPYSEPAKGTSACWAVFIGIIYGYKLTRSTEKRSQFLIFWRKKKKGTKVKHFYSVHTKNNGTKPTSQNICN